MVRSAGRIVYVAPDMVHDLLGGGEVAGRKDHEQAIGRGREHMHLAVGGHVVHPGIGARIRGEHEAVLERKPDAIGHWQNSVLDVEESMGPEPDQGKS